ALRDGADEETPGERRSHQVPHRKGTGRLSENGDLIRIAAKRRDVPTDPLQRRDLIEKTVVPRRVMLGFPGQLRMGQKSQRADPIVQADDDDAFRCELRAVVDSHRARAFVEAAAIDPEHDRQPGARIPRRRPYIEEETVFADRPLRHELFGPGQPRARLVLHTAGAERGRLAHALPPGRGLRRTPADSATRRRRKWNSEICGDAPSPGPPRKRSRVDSDDVEPGLEGPARNQECQETKGDCSPAVCAHPAYCASLRATPA